MTFVVHLCVLLVCVLVESSICVCVCVCVCVLLHMQIKMSAYFCSRAIYSGLPSCGSQLRYYLLDL